MNIKPVATSILILSLLSCAGCRKKTPAAVEEREKWILSLNDSVALYQKQSDSVASLLSETRNRISEIIGDFDYVSNPREVEGYYIYKGWKQRYPLKQTGLLARITESEGLELIATLTGAHFNEIGVSAGSTTLSSEVVPHDQALNYRAGNLNTVCFSGNKADSIAGLISENESSSVNVVYLNPGKTGAISLPEDEKKMIAATWRLYSLQKSVHNNEKELPRLSGKIAACRRMLESADSTTVKD